MSTPLNQGIDANGVLMRYNAVSALGLLQRAGANITPGVTAEARDGDGSVAEATRTDWRSGVDVEYIPFDGVTFPPKNAIVQVAGFQDSEMNGAYRVNSIGENYTNTDYPSKPVNLIRYLDNSIPAATTTTTTTTTTT